MPYSGTEEQMETKLGRIADKSKNEVRPIYTSLYHMCSSIIRKKINYIVDADIKGFFDNMRHEWIINS